MQLFLTIHLLCTAKLVCARRPPLEAANEKHFFITRSTYLIGFGSVLLVGVLCALTAWRQASSEDLPRSPDMHEGKAICEAACAACLATNGAGTPQSWASIKDYGSARGFSAEGRRDCILEHILALLPGTLQCHLGHKRSRGSTRAMNSKSRSQCSSGMSPPIACTAIRKLFADRGVNPAHRQSADKLAAARAAARPSKLTSSANSPNTRSQRANRSGRSARWRTSCSIGGASHTDCGSEGAAQKRNPNRGIDQHFLLIVTV